MMRAALFIVLAAGALVVGSSSSRADDACGTCHPQIRTQYDQGAHVRQFGCVGCHGGDPTAVGLEAHAKEKGFIGKPSRAAIPALCGSCHSDPTRMKPFGLATDQYAKYQTSEHGMRLARGDTHVAVCTDCHGTHRILPPDEPTSPVARQNIPTTCGHCHSDQTLMAQYKLPADQEEKFRASIHGVALLVDEHPDAPTCATCHGAHGATAPGVTTVGQVCGHCHAVTRDYFNESPHRQAAADSAMSECVSCHGHHDIAAPTAALFDTACKDCHQTGSSEFSTGQKLKTLLSRAGESLDAAARDMTEVQKSFPTVVQHRARLQQARAYLIEARTVQHSLSVNRTDDLTRSARSLSDDVRASIHGLAQNRQIRYLELAVAWVFLLFATSVAYLYKRERRRRRAADTGAATEPRT